MKLSVTIIKSDNISRLGFESEDMLYSKYEDLKAGLPECELVPIKDEITRLRRIKTPKELEYIKQAQSIGDKVFSEILDYIKPGVTELELAARIEYLLKIYGGEKQAFLLLWHPGLTLPCPMRCPHQKR